jgi:hypothetical protein
MKSKLLVLFCFFLMALGCSKNNNSTGPTIKIKTYTNQVNPDGAFNAVLSYSQNSGSLSGDSLVVLRRRFNQTQVPDDQKRDTFITLLPQTPNASKAEFSATLVWNFIQYGINGENDSCDFRFVLIDQNGNHSDTVGTGLVVIYQ